MLERLKAGQKGTIRHLVQFTDTDGATLPGWVMVPGKPGVPQFMGSLKESDMT